MNRSTSTRGSILIVTLWIVALLSLLALTLAGRSRLAMRQASWSEHEAVAEQVMLALAERCVLLIQNDLNPDIDAYTEEWGQRYFLDNATLARELGLDESMLMGLEARVVAVDESGKLNVNYVTQLPELLELCISEASREENAKVIADQIIGWWDQDMDGLGESESYANYSVMNGNLRFVEELVFVRGISPWLFWGEDHNHNGLLDAEENDGALFLPEDNVDGHLQTGLIALFSTYGHENYEVNLNGVSKPVFRAILGLLFEQAEAERLTESFFEYRQGADGLDGTQDDKHFEQLTDLNSLWEAEEVQALNTMTEIDWVMNSTAFRFYIDINFTGIHFNTSASIVVIRNEGDVRIAEWHEE